MSDIQGLGASQNVRPAVPAVRTSPVRPEIPIETPSSFGNDAVQMSGGFFVPFSCPHPGTPPRPLPANAWRRTVAPRGSRRWMDSS